MHESTINLHVNWGDTDKAGIVYYPNFFKWFDIAGHSFFRSCGLPPLKLEEEEQIILPLLDAKCTFLHPLFYDDLITIHTSIEKLSNKTITLKHRITREDERIAEGYEVRGWVYQGNGEIRAVQIPDDKRKIIVHGNKNAEVEPRYNA